MLEGIKMAERAMRVVPGGACEKGLHIVKNGFTDGVDEFEKALRSEDLSAATVRGYVSDVRLFGRWYEEAYGEAIEPGRVVRVEVQAYRDHLQAGGAKGSSVNRRLAALVRYFGWIGADPNPAAGVRGVRVVDPGVQSLSLQDLRRVLREVHRGGVVRDIALLEVLSNTAMRVGELVGLEVSDVEIRERSGSVEIRSGKGRSSRIVPLNADARRAVSAYLEVRGAGEGRLFRGERGSLTAAGVWTIVRKYGRRAGIEGLRVHQLRHTALRRMLDEGVDLATAATIAGHSDLRTTLRYTRPSKAGLEAAVRKLEMGGGDA
jgi:site-specific recombinase XerD